MKSTLGEFKVEDLEPILGTTIVLVEVEMRTPIGGTLLNRRALGVVESVAHDVGDETLSFYFTSGQRISAYTNGALVQVSIPDHQEWSEG
jgi:hypothetical protein